MMTDESEGLGVSVLIYIAAILCALVLFVGPVLLANGPSVYENPGTENISTVLALRRANDRYPLAHLKQEDIVDPAALAAFNAKNKNRNKTAEQRPHRTAATRLAPTQKHTYAEATPERSRGPFSLLFSLF